MGCNAMVMIPVELSKDVEDAARSLGLLTSEKIAQMIEAEVQRQRREAWEHLQAMIAPVQAAFREEYGHLSDDEVQAMIDEWIHEADEDAAPDERSS